MLSYWSTKYQEDHDAEEQIHADYNIRLSDFGFPMSNYDYRMTVKTCLQLKQFKNNMPGYEW